MGTTFPWRFDPKPTPARPHPPEKPSETEARLATHYVGLRAECIALEELLGARGTDLSEMDLKRLDKAVTVMKVAFKIVKRILRSRGFRELKPTGIIIEQIRREG